MRDHLSNKHGTFFKKYLSSYYSTRETKKCYQRNVGQKRLAFKYNYPETHQLTVIRDRESIEYYQEQFRLTIIATCQSFTEQPSVKCVNDFTVHQDASLQEGECVNATRFSTSVKNFLCDALEDTSNFEESFKLAKVVNSYAQDKSLSIATMVHYLSTFAKVIDYLTLH